MEGGALFDPGFLGGQFLWWVGQIPDDATWRGNTEPGVYSEKDGQLGWGRRYKVRIIGIHDKDEETIPSDQLPWANVMYPITAGSGAANAYQTPQIRQGNFVFGFFMDGADQQVPVIMGILGNNPQTKLSTSAGTSQDNFSATSGYARSQDPARIQGRAFPPDMDLGQIKPMTPEAQKEAAEVPPGLILNKFGQRPDRPLNSQQQKDLNSAKAEAEAAGLTGAALLEKVNDGIAKGVEARKKKAKSPLAQAEPGASLEAGASAPNLRSAADGVQDELYKKKTVLLKPDKKVEAAQKAIQTEMDNIATLTRAHLKTYEDYTAAVTNKVPDMEPEIARSAKQIAKYEKISVDKMAEYSLKAALSAAAATTSLMPSSQRFQYADVQTGFVNNMMEEYLEITNGLEDSVKGLLTQALDLKNKEKQAAEAAKSLPKNKPASYADVAICTSEEFLGKSIALQKPKISAANNNMIDKMNMFLDDMTSQLAGLTGSLSDIKNQLQVPDGSVTAALQFENITPQVFPFQMPPETAVSDFYTMAEGSGAQPDSKTPSPMAISQIASNIDQPKPMIDIPKEIPFAVPSKDQGLVDLVKNKVMDNASLEGALDAAAKVSPQAAAAKAAINVAKGQDPKDAARQAASDIYGV